MARSTTKAIEKTVSVKALLVISFIEGASVMATELVGAKMIAPFFGNSIYVWASVLAITLGGLAAGYFMGGAVSKKYPHHRTLFYIIFAASFFVFIMPSFGSWVMTMNLDMELIPATVLSCLLFLLPPMVFFGMTSPVIINLLDSGHNAGQVSGKIYGISTVGGIIMTFITGLYLIPYAGLKTTVYINAFILFLIPFIYFLLRKKYMIPGAIVLLFVFGIAGAVKSGNPVKRSHLRVLYKNDGLLGQLIVVDDLRSEKRSLQVNNTAQTFIHIPTGRSQWPYIHKIALYSSWKPAGATALICGLGGGNLVNEYHRLGFSTDVVEIDKRMAYIAEKYFSMKPPANLFIDDARHYIKTAKQKYDIIVFDMLSAESQPSNMYTVECFRELHSLLKDDGIVFIHYQNQLEGEYSLAARSIGRTLQEAGFVTRLLKRKAPADKIAEIIYVASGKEVDLGAQNYERRDPFVDPFNFPMTGNVFLSYDFSTGKVLTDDKPVIEFLHMNTLPGTRGSAMTEVIPILLEQGIEIIE